MAGKASIHRKWLFAPLEGNRTPWRIWIWWEKRRLICNVTVLVTAFCSYFAFMVFAECSGQFAPGEDPVEPILVAAGEVIGIILWNFAYCLGPISDIIFQRFKKQNHMGPILLKLGLALSVVVLCIPNAIWFVIWASKILKQFRQ